MYLKASLGIGVGYLYYKAEPTIRNFAIECSENRHWIVRNVAARLLYALYIPSVITDRIPRSVDVLRSIPIICKRRGKHNKLTACTLNELQYTVGEWPGSLYHRVLRSVNPSSKINTQASFSVAKSIIDYTNTFFNKYEYARAPRLMQRAISGGVLLTFAASVLISGAIGVTAATLSLCTGGIFPKLNTLAYHELHDAIKINALVVCAIKIIHPLACLEITYNKGVKIGGWGGSYDAD